MKKHNSNNYDSILVYLSEEHTPIAFENKVKELVEQGAFENEEDAKRWVRSNPIELELYYHIDCGLFGVESEAVECCEIYDPYDGVLMEECEDE